MICNGRDYTARRVQGSIKVNMTRLVRYIEYIYLWEALEKENFDMLTV